jgi:phosphoglycerol transferase MdoB-like AlkP superfamily enzyme
MAVSMTPLRERLRPLIWLGACFVVIALLLRLALLVRSGTAVPLNPLTWLYIVGVGLCYDLITFVYVAWPMVLFLWLVPRRAYLSRPGRALLYLLGLVLIYGFLLVAAAEWIFWGEFGTRFNFIAVDYLVYTTEVLGDIRQSYPLAAWFSVLAIVTLTIVLLTRRGLRARDSGSRFAARSLVAAGWLALTVLSVMLVDATMKDRFENPAINSLAGNGIYQFFAAFRANRLDYRRFYRTLPDARAHGIVRSLLKTPDATYLDDDPADITREIRNPGPEQHLNVVLISVESLSAKYLAHFGNRRNLTPNLDALADEGLFFTHLYANGTRTVRGLEALTLSVPPTPGDSLVRQHHNENLFSLGDIFDDRGYVSEFVYGGYGYFDNMDYFFAHNGYTAVDRNDIPKGATIHSENVWGVADEDLYTLAMQQMDAIHARGKPFFLHIMTTSNHRPYTFPERRVDLPQGKRSSAVKYTDWAIGDFITRMRAKSYFADTVFVITADHCASSAGRSRIPVNRYHIPLLIYAPAHLEPRRIDRLTAQIDIAPTLLGLLHFSYRSRFFGYDILRLEPGRGRAFPSTYEKLGYLKDDVLTILWPRRQGEEVRPDFATGDATPLASPDASRMDEAIASYQVAADLFKSGRMRRRPEDATPVAPAPALAAARATPPSPTSPGCAAGRRRCRAARRRGRRGVAVAR